MLRVTLCLLMMSQSQSAGICEDQSLLQSRLRSAPSLDHPSEQAASLLESVRSLAHDVSEKKFGGDIQPVNVAIASVKTALEALQSTTNAAHTAAQNAINAQRAEVGACHSSDSHGTSVREALEAETDGITQCQNSLAATSQEETRLCQGAGDTIGWEHVAGGISETFPALSATQLALWHAEEDWSQIHQALGQIEAWMGTQWSTINSAYTECEAATTAANTVETSCNGPTGTINTLTEKFCQHKEACILAEACHNHESAAYQTLKIEAQVGEDSRQAQEHTIQQVVCILDLIAGAVSSNDTISDSDFTDCEDGADNEVAHLTLDMTDPAEFTDCQLPTIDITCASVPLPDAWEGGAPVVPLVQEGTFVLEFCTGPRNGQQFTVTLPDPATRMLPDTETHKSTFVGPTICYDTSETDYVYGGIGFSGTAQDGNYANQPDELDTREDHVTVGYPFSDGECATKGLATRFRMNNGNCGSEFSNWVRSQNGNSDFVAAMTAIGGTGWDIFAGFQQGEDFKVVSTPMLTS